MRQTYGKPPRRLGLVLDPRQRTLEERRELILVPGFAYGVIDRRMATNVLQLGPTAEQEAEEVDEVYRD